MAAPRDWDRELGASVVQWLRRLREEGEEREELDVAAACIAEAFGLGPEEDGRPGADDDDDLAGAPPLRAVYEAGVTAIGAKTNKSIVEAAQRDLAEDSLFAAMVESVTKGGYFDGCETGTPLYYARFKKLVDRYRSECAPADVPAEPRRVDARAIPTEPRLEAELRLLRDPRCAFDTFPQNAQPNVTPSASRLDDLAKCGRAPRLQSAPLSERQADAPLLCFLLAGIMTKPAIFDAVMADPNARKLTTDLRADPQLMRRLTNDAGTPARPQSHESHHHHHHHQSLGI